MNLMEITVKFYSEEDIMFRWRSCGKSFILVLIWGSICSVDLPYLSQLFEDGVCSAGCVSTEDCGSNNLIAARSSKIFYRINSVNAEKLPDCKPLVFGRLPNQTDVNCCYDVLSLQVLVVRLKPKVNVNDLSAKIKLKSNFKAK